MCLVRLQFRNSVVGKVLLDLLGRLVITLNLRIVLGQEDIRVYILRID